MVTTDHDVTVRVYLAAGPNAGLAIVTGWTATGGLRDARHAPGRRRRASARVGHRAGREHHRGGQRRPAGGVAVTAVLNGQTGGASSPPPRARARSPSPTGAGTTYAATALSPIPGGSGALAARPRPRGGRHPRGHQRRPRRAPCDVCFVTGSWEGLCHSRLDTHDRLACCDRTGARAFSTSIRSSSTRRAATTPVRWGVELPSRLGPDAGLTHGGGMLYAGAQDLTAIHAQQHHARGALRLDRPVGRSVQQRLHAGESPSRIDRIIEKVGANDRRRLLSTARSRHHDAAHLHGRFRRGRVTVAPITGDLYRWSFDGSVAECVERLPAVYVRTRHKRGHRHASACAIDRPDRPSLPSSPDLVERPPRHRDYRLAEDVSTGVGAIRVEANPVRSAFPLVLPARGPTLGADGGGCGRAEVRVPVTTARRVGSSDVPTISLATLWDGSEYPEIRMVDGPISASGRGDGTTTTHHDHRPPHDGGRDARARVAGAPRRPIRRVPRHGSEGLVTDLTHWLPSILALVGAAAAWGSARTDLRQIREVLTEHRHDAATRRGGAGQARHSLSHQAELTARAAVLERDVSTTTAATPSADDAVTHVAEISARLRDRGAGARPC